MLGWAIRHVRHGISFLRLHVYLGTLGYEEVNHVVVSSERRAVQCGLTPLVRTVDIHPEIKTQLERRNRFVFLPHVVSDIARFWAPEAG